MEGNLYLDCETTGKIRDGLHWKTHYYLFPRIVSIAWRLNGIEKYFIVNQVGKPIPHGATLVHGITDEMCAQSPHYIQVVLKELIADALEARLIVAHNTYFDTSIAKANTLREFGENSKEAIQIIQALDKSKRRDTMRQSATYAGGWSTLVKLHEKLFGEPYAHPHNAMADVRAVEDCYTKLVELKVIKP